MNRRNIFGLSLITALGISMLPGVSFAQQKPLKDQIVGTWTVVSWDQINKDGSKVQRFGTSPEGVNVFDTNGRFFVMFARPDLPKLASGNPTTATPEENKAIMEGAIAYFGTYSVDEMGRSVILQIESSTFPNQVGSEQKRMITSISGSEIRLSNPAASAGGSINYIMKRAATLASR